MEQYILAIDQSTAGTKAMLFDAQGKVAVRHDIPHEQIITPQGWVEHNPQEIFDNLVEAVKIALEKGGILPQQVIGAGLTNQRETAIVWNTKTGEPVHPAIVWQCTRGEAICQRIAAQNQQAESLVAKTTGIPLSPYYSAAKFAWVLESLAENGKSQGDLCCSTMDSWLIFKLCGGAPKTDYSNASRTQLFDIHTLTWSKEVASLFGITTDMLPEVSDSDSLFGHSDFGGIFPEPIPIHSVFGDSHAALFGQGCHKAGMAKATYGTGSSIMMNIGERPILSQKGLVTSLAWKVSGKPQYVLEGNINYTGGVIKWLVEDLELLASPKEAGEIAANTPHQEGLYIVPAFSGLGAPYWDSGATAAIWGMTRETKKAQLVRGAEECISYQIADILFLMEEETQTKLAFLQVDGGATGDAFLMQFQADILGCALHVPQVEELSGAGAAYAAGLAMKFYTREALFGHAPKREYSPQMTDETRQEYYSGWQQAVENVLSASRRNP